MKINVIGGSGFLGSHLLRKLKTSYQLSNLDKNPSVEYNDITSIGNICNIDDIRKNIGEPDFVVLLAAEYKDDVFPRKLYYDVNVEGTRNVLKVMEEKGLNKIIFTSSVSIYGLNRDNPDEEATQDPFGDYGISKWQGELILREWYNNDPQNRTLIIIRPTVIFGPGNTGNVYNLLKQIAVGRFIRIGPGNNKKSMSFVENVAGFLKYLLDKNYTGYHLFNYADKPDYSMNELIAASEKSINRKIPMLRVPYFLGYLGGLTFDVITRLTGKKFRINSVRVKKFCANTQFNSNKMLATGYIPSYKLDDGLDITIKSIIKNTAK